MDVIPSTHYIRYAENGLHSFTDIVSA